jgi:hypothetical protein
MIGITGITKRSTDIYPLLTIKKNEIARTAETDFECQPVGYSYLSTMNFQQPRTLLKRVKLQELVAKRIFLVSSLQYAAITRPTETRLQL